MKTELKLVDHSMIHMPGIGSGSKCVEIWHGGKLIGTVYGADGTGVRIITKHPIIVTQHSGTALKLAEVKIDTEKIL